MTQTTAQSASWRSTYLLGVALLLPIGTIVLVCYYFTRMSPFSAEVEHSPWAFSVIAIAGGLSALMAAVLALFSSATYRARVRFEGEFRKLQRYLNEDVARERTRLIRNLDLVSATQQVSMAIKQEVEFDRILAVILEQLEYFSHADTITVFTVDDDGQAVPQAERRKGLDLFPPELNPESVQRSLVAEAIRGGRQLRSLDERTGEFVLAVYFSTPEGVRGIVRLSRNVADDPDFVEDIPAYEQAIGQLVRMVSLGLKTANIWNRAIRDEKTGLYNNNHYQDQMRRQIAQARRTGIPLSLIMLDIDKFKDVNDTYGHLAGDAVLAEVAAILKREAREGDTPYRYGGEELCIVCTGTTEADAAAAAERLRQLIATTEFRDDRGRLLPISASFGVAEFDPSENGGDQGLKELCDRALYMAKDKGRNCVVVAEGQERFRILERGGDPAAEIKHRMGLAGDNTKLNAPATGIKSGARDQLGRTINALATGLCEAAGDDSGRARVVDSVVREATELLTRNLSVRLDTDGQKREAVRAVNEPRATRSGAEETSAKPKRKAPKRKSSKPRNTKKPKPSANPDSDRLDFLTDDEGEELLRGKAPSKRSRAAARSRS